MRIFILIIALVSTVSLARCYSSTPNSIYSALEKGLKKEESISRFLRTTSNEKRMAKLIKLAGKLNGDHIKDSDKAEVQSDLIFLRDSINDKQCTDSTYERLIRIASYADRSLLVDDMSTGRKPSRIENETLIPKIFQHYLTLHARACYPIQSSRFRKISESMITQLNRHEKFADTYVALMKPDCLQGFELKTVCVLKTNTADLLDVKNLIEAINNYIRPSPIIYTSCIEDPNSERDCPRQYAFLHRHFITEPYDDMNAMFNQLYTSTRFDLNFNPLLEKDQEVLMRSDYVYHVHKAISVIDYDTFLSAVSDFRKSLKKNSV